MLLTEEYPYLPANRTWQAQWIWAAGADWHQENQVVLFRGTCALSDQKDLKLLINAATNYRLWVNGELLGDGPCPSASHHSYYDQYELNNVFGSQEKLQIAVLVRTSRLPKPLHAGLLLEVIDGTGNVLLASDEQWKAQKSDAWRPDTYCFAMNKLSPYQEHFNARFYDADWMSEAYDDTSWAAAVCVQKTVGRVAWSHIVKRPIALLERDYFRPIAITEQSTCIHLDNRKERQDASIEATQPGTQELVTELIKNADELCDADGTCTLYTSATTPEDPAWDGVRDAAITMQFEEEVTAFIEIEYTAPENAEMYISTAERLIDGQLQTTIESRFTEYIRCTAGKHKFLSLHWRAFRYLRLRVHGAQEGLIIHNLRAVRVRTPMPREATFTAGKGQEQIDALCRRTIRLCSVDGIFDTPWREAAQWLGDVANVTVPALHWVYGDEDLSSKFMCQAGLNSNPDGLLSNLSNCEPEPNRSNIPDYSLWWIYALREHYLYTGNEVWYRMFYPELQRIMRWHMHYLDEDGFLNNVNNWVFIDWADVTKTGSSSAYNALFVVACDVSAEIASFNGDQHTADIFKQTAARIRQKFDERFWCAERKVIVDAIVDGKQTEKVSEHGVASALWADCLSDERAAEIIQSAYVENKRAGWVECQPYYTRIVLEGLYRYDRRDLALQVIEDRWGKRFRDRGWDTCLEEWYCNGSFRNGSWMGFMRTTSHAWSAAASEFYTRRLTGVTVLEAGCKRVSVNPYQGEFAYKLRIPLQNGWITVDYTPGNEPMVTTEGTVELVDRQTLALS